MKVFVSNDFQGYWPVGTAAVVLAPDEETARAMLQRTLIADGLPGDSFTLLELLLDEQQTVILCNGNY